jgi:hypothetical protein
MIAIRSFVGHCVEIRLAVLEWQRADSHREQACARHGNALDHHQRETNNIKAN